MPGRVHRTARFLLPVLLAAATPMAGSAQASGLRNITFETTEVTAADVALSADGQWLIFTMLGKLFRLPVRGGDAEQLTSGPFFDVAPAISPDGKTIAFQSDRDGSAGNVFLLTLASKEITQLTHETWADRPAWAPDGKSVVYLQLDRASWNPLDTMPRPPAAVRRMAVGGGVAETLRAQAEVWSAFYLVDGRLAWTIVQRDQKSRRVTTRVEVRAHDGTVATLHRFSDMADPVVPSGRSRGLYAVTGTWAPYRPYDAHLAFSPLPTGPDQPVTPVSAIGRKFAVSSDSGMLFFSDHGHLWRIRARDGRTAVIPFRAHVTLAIREPVRPPRWTPVALGTIGSLRTITEPQLSPDGAKLVFRALGHLWIQPLAEDRQAERLVDGPGTESDAAFSPDGQQMVFIRNVDRKRDVQVVDFRSRQIRTVAPDHECGYEDLSWSGNGQLIAATQCNANYEVFAIATTGEPKRKLADASEWDPYPELSADGRTLTFQASFPRSHPALYRQDLTRKTKPEALFNLPEGPGGHRLARNELWLANGIQNRPGIRVTKLHGDGEVAREERIIPSADERSFSLTADGLAVLYVAGGKLWRESLHGGARTEIPVRLAITAPTPPPVLLQRVRVLDFAAGGFSEETSMLVDGGRIRWVGQAGAVLPPGTLTVDAQGRFAIPGLFDVHRHFGDCGGGRSITNGVTSVRNMGGRLEEENAAADQSDYTSDVVPRCFYSGRILEGPNGWSRSEDWGFVHVADEADTRNLVRQWQAGGAQFIKLYNMMPWPLQRAAADEARRVGLPVAAHGLLFEQAVKGVTLGFAYLTHWLWQGYDDVLQMMASAGTRWDPTLGGIGIELAFRSDPVLYGRASRSYRMTGDNMLRGFWLDQLRSMQAGYRRGIIFNPGTDGGPEGVALQWELEFYAEAGIPPFDILRFATQAAAQTVGADHDLGTLEVGKLADLVLLDKNPLESIRNTQTIWRVMKGGWMQPSPGK